MACMKPRVFSAMQPTSESLHLGNYLGALLQWVRLQDTHDAIYSVVDLHALTVAPDPSVLRDRTRRTAAQYLAAGVDPERSLLFVQSHVPQHVELMWILSTFTGMGEAGRMTQFKDKSAKVGESGTNVGLFTYPVLMAADILLYDTNVVPVGEDQRQHLELSRDLAQRLNTRLGEGTAVIPEPHIVKEVAKIQDLQDPTKKMSKSASSPKGLIEILQEPKAIAKNIKSATTDTETVIRYDEDAKPGVSNLLRIYSAFTGRAVDAIVADYEGKMYGHLKSDLADVVVEALTPVHDSAMEWIESPERLDSVLADGAAKASAVAQVTLDRIYDRVGLLPALHR
ncbi:tryptophan--tRNA ligase [Demequina capsici]|uniref:Tryptophan--tRNA ligase n=1 Tax=Demequina capsici TaxID=3075620 RepID=A0AA96JA60_9MICO|nr:tryptophan--tRNA ligase [Demequina sp. PMTSA13]WNM28032.1 tryptophan--tRNA ligase [Demequina sp. PMTSA13]